MSGLPVDLRPASRKRLLLAVYLDFIIFGVIWGFVHQEIYSLLPELRGMGLILRVIFFTLVELILYKIIDWTPGRHLLSIKYLDARSLLPADDSDDTDESMPGKRIAVVDAGIKDHESWLTIVVAVVFINEGLKSLVRWTMWTPPLPLFGFETTAEVSAVCLMLMGAVECYIAYCIFRLRKSAFAVGVVYIGISLLSTIISWRLWDPWVEELTYRRRAYMDLPVRPGEVAFMQKLAPEILVVALLVYLSLLLAVRKRMVYSSGSG